MGELDPDSVSSSSAASKFALDVNDWRAFTLLAKQPVAETTVKFTFELPSRKQLVRTSLSLLSPVLQSSSPPHADFQCV